MIAVAPYFIIIAAAAAITIILYILYMRHINKIVKGEIHDTHTILPDPHSGANIIYKISIFILLISLVLHLSTLAQTLNNLTTHVNNIQSQFYLLSNTVDRTVEETKIVKYEQYELGEIDPVHHTVKVNYSVVLNQVQEDAKVYLSLDDKEILLENTSKGVYKANFDVELFKAFENVFLCINNSGTLTLENTDLPHLFAFEALPIASCGLTDIDFKYKNNKLNYSGSVTYYAKNETDIKTASLTYITGNKALKTIDVTDAIKNASDIPFEKGLNFENDASLRLEIITTNGYKIQYELVVYYSTNDETIQNKINIYDSNNTLLWNSIE